MALLTLAWPSDASKFEFRSPQKRSEQAGPKVLIVERFGDPVEEFLLVVGHAVGQVGVLGVVPNRLDRIQIGSVRRQPLDREPLGTLFLELPTAERCTFKRSQTKMIGRRVWRRSSRRNSTKSGARMLWSCIVNQSDRRRERGRSNSAAITESRSWRSQAYWIGVCPRGAHVRRFSGCSRKPLSSTNTMTA